MEKIRLVTAKEYIWRKRIAPTTFFDWLRKGRISYYQAGGKRKYFNLNDGLVWKRHQK